MSTIQTFNATFTVSLDADSQSLSIDQLNTLFLLSGTSNWSAKCKSKHITSIVLESHQCQSVPLKSQQATTSSVPSESEFLSALRKAQCSFLSYSDSNTPWFETLFPDVDVPELVEDKLPKTAFNPLFARIARRLKSLAQEQHISVAHLPKDVASRIEKVIIQAVQKSTTSKAPARVLKDAKKFNHYPAEPTSKKTNEKKNASSSAPPKPLKAPKTSSPSSNKAKATPAKPATPSSSKAKTPAPMKPSPPSTASPSASSTDVIDCLKSAASPAFYFAADKTPAFESLFPKTTRPATTLVSGNVRVHPDSFNPLIKQRISSAHAYLRKSNVKCSRLPKSFLEYQTRLICRSIEKSYSDRKALRKSQSDKKKAKQTQKKTVQFVPGQVPSSVSQSRQDASAEPEHSAENTQRHLRVAADLLRAIQTQQVSPDPAFPSLIIKALPVLRDYSIVHTEIPSPIPSKVTISCNFTPVNDTIPIIQVNHSGSSWFSISTAAQKSLNSRSAAFYNLSFE